MAAATARRRLGAGAKTLERETHGGDTKRRGWDRKWRRVVGTVPGLTGERFCSLTRSALTSFALSVSLCRPNHVFCLSIYLPLQHIRQLQKHHSVVKNVGSGVTVYLILSLGSETSYL